MKTFKIYTINEWKETVNYSLSKSFLNLKNQIIEWFENDDLLKELEFDKFEFDSSITAQIYPAYLFFNENDYQYKIEFVVDINLLEDDSITNCAINFTAYTIETNEVIGTIERSDLSLSEFNPDYIIEIITDFKTEFVEDKKDISDII